MKRILITGTKGYLGTSLKQYLSQWPEYAVTSLSLREGQWETFDLRGYDAVYHAAALVHQKKTKDDPACLGEYRKTKPGPDPPSGGKGQGGRGRAVPLSLHRGCVRPDGPLWQGDRHRGPHPHSPCG